MASIIDFLAVAAAALAYAVILAGILPRCRGIYVRIARGQAAMLMLFPLLISADHVRARAFAAVVCVDLLFKSLDLVRQQTRGRLESTSFAKLLGFLIPFPPLLVVLEQHKTTAVRIGVRDVLVGILAGVVVWLSFLVLFISNRLKVIQDYYWLDHAVKVAIFVVLIEAIAQLFCKIERLVGFDTQPAVRQAYQSVTVAEFWSRYNTRVHDWFFYNIFVPFRRTAPGKGIMLTILISAVVHELMFGIATSRFDGYQFLFFTLQGPAILASRPLSRWARRYGLLGITALRGSTIVWMYFTSMLFFHGVNRIFSFTYASTPWLP